jgi:hypothetical protein
VLGQPTAQKADAWGVCSFDGSCRGCSADIFEGAKYITTIVLPTFGHAEVRIPKVLPTEG